MRPDRHERRREGLGRFARHVLGSRLGRARSLFPILASRRRARLDLPFTHARPRQLPPERGVRPRELLLAVREFTHQGGHLARVSNAQRGEPRGVVAVDGCEVPTRLPCLHRARVRAQLGRLLHPLGFHQRSPQPSNGDERRGEGGRDLARALERVGERLELRGVTMPSRGFQRTRGPSKVVACGGARELEGAEAIAVVLGNFAPSRDDVAEAVGVGGRGVSGEPRRKRHLSVNAPTGARPVCVRPPLGIMNERGSLDRQCAILRRDISQVGPIAPSPKGLWRLCQSLGKCMSVCLAFWQN